MLKIFNPHNFEKWSRIFLPYFIAIFILTLSLGLYYSLFNSPADYQQGELVRIMYVHVPAAWMSLAIYSFITICSIITLICRTKLSYILAFSAAPIGAIFCFIALATGSIWGKPIWGTWWVWDARLTSMLLLFLIYMSYIAIINSGDSVWRAEKPACIIAVIGCINVPIVKFSVYIWYSLHQKASVMKLGAPTIHHSMLKPLLIMFLSFCLLFIIILIMRSLITLKSLSNQNILSS